MSKARVQVRRRASRTALCALLLAASAGAPALSACGDTLQDQPIAHNTLETLVMAPYPVYWLGASFQGLAITEVTHDPGGAFTIRYGDCTQGGQGICVPPVRMVTSPDNSFLPGASAPHRRVPIRGVVAIAAADGRTLVIPTGGVIVAIYALSSRLAYAAAQTAVPINRPGAPGGALPARLPDTGFAETPLPVQRPSALGPAP